MGTYELPFVVPNLNKETQRIPMSSVVLSSQRVDMREALFNASKDKEKLTQVSNPLVHEGMKLIPSVTRVFSKAKDMYFYLQTYQQDSETVKPMFAFYRGQDKVFETSPLGSVDAMTNRLKTIPLQLQFPLDKLEAGEYLCQVTVLDPKGEKAGFWQAPVMLVP